jgi:hypothetical protein
MRAGEQHRTEWSSASQSGAQTLNRCARTLHRSGPRVDAPREARAAPPARTGARPGLWPLFSLNQNPLASPPSGCFATLCAVTEKENFLSQFDARTHPQKHAPTGVAKWSILHAHHVRSVSSVLYTIMACSIRSWLVPSACGRPYLPYTITRLSGLCLCSQHVYLTILRCCDAWLCHLGLWYPMEYAPLSPLIS